VNTTVLVIAKEPLPGRVKTRLSPAYTPEQAARLARAALVDTLDVVRRSNTARRVLVLEGRRGDWVPDGFEVIGQRGDGLDERLANAFAAVDGPCLLIGMDTPQVTVDLLAPALGEGAWAAHDAWFGPAADGGFWALGFRDPRPDLLRGVPMSRDDTGAIQYGRLLDAGLVIGRLPLLRDVDTPSDVAEVAALAPHGSFARTAHRLGSVTR
jgi:glycosyltransferase A (GT-A) superfamily protein (DUF2064 family)